MFYYLCFQLASSLSEDEYCCAICHQSLSALKFAARIQHLKKCSTALRTAALEKQRMILEQTSRCTVCLSVTLLSANTSTPARRCREF